MKFDCGGLVWWCVPHVPCTGRWILNHLATRKVPKVLLKQRKKADVLLWVWLSLLWKLNQSYLWPWIPEPFQSDPPPSWGPDDPGDGSPDMVGALWATCRTKAAGVKGPLGKGCKLKSALASICCCYFLFLAHQAFSQSIELPSSFLKFFSHRGDSSVNRRKWFSPLLFPCPPPFLFLLFLLFGHTVQHVGSQFPDQGSNLHPLHWKHGILISGPPGKSLPCPPSSCTGCASDVYSSSFYTLWQLSSLFPSSLYPPQSIFSLWFYSNHLLFSANLSSIVLFVLLLWCFSLFFCIFERLCPWRRALSVYEMKV